MKQRAALHMLFTMYRVLCMLILINAVTVSADSIVAYDCEGDVTNITAISLSEVGPCNNISPEIVERKVHVQLVQKRSYDKVPFTQCFVLVELDIVHCGMFSHNSKIGTRKSLTMISQERCNEIVYLGTYKLATGEVFDNIKVNSSYHA